MGRRATGSILKRGPSLKGNTVVKRGKKKGVTWAKGHSSDCNPTTKLHRQAALQQWVSAPTPSPLGSATGNIGSMKNLSISNNGVEEGSEKDGASVGGESRFTTFTNCSNPTFDKVHRTWKSGSPLQKDVLAVLGAVTDVIHQAKGEESETEYFAALLTTLEQLSTARVPERLAAAAYLLNLVIPKVPASVLRGKFGPASQLLYQLLGSFTTVSNAGLMQRYLISSFFGLLKAQPIDVWNDPILGKMFDGVLTYSLSPHPRVRKTLRAGIAQLVPTDPDSGEGNAMVSINPHPVFRYCAEFAVGRLDKELGKNDDVVQNMLDLLSLSLPGMSAPSFKTSTEAIFRVLCTVPSDSSVGLAALNAVYIPFSQLPSEKTLPPELNVQILNALFDFRPEETNVTAYSAWLRVLAEGINCLSLRSLKLSSVFVTKLFEAALQADCGRGEGQNVTVCLENVMENCCSPISKSEDSEEFLPILGKCLEMLKDQFMMPDGGLLPALCYEISAFFKAIGVPCGQFESFTAILQNAASLRESDDFSSSISKSAEDLVWSAVRHVGVESVLSAIPLNLQPELIDYKTDFRRAWLLPVLRRSIGTASLDFFFTRLFPIAMGLTKRVKEWLNAKEDRLAQVYSIAEYQIWELLPPICKGATDVGKNLSKYAKILGVALTERADIRIPVMASLRNLYTFHHGEENAQVVLRKFGKNYCNLLIGLYTGKEEGSFKKSALATFRLYLNLAPEELLDSYLDTAFGILEATEEKENRLAVMDILISLVPHLSKAGLGRLKTTILVPFLSKKFQAKELEKKTYRILEEMCKCSANAESHEEFLAENQLEILDLLFNSPRKCSPPAVASRIVSAAIVLDRTADQSESWGDYGQKFFAELLENLVGSKSTKTKKAAAQALVKIILFKCRSEGNSEEDVIISALNEIDSFSKINEDRKDEIAAALTAKRLIFHQFHSEMSPKLLAEFLGPVTAFIKDYRTPIVEQALLFIKKVIAVLPEYLLIQAEALILQSFFGQNPKVRRNLRRVNENILRALLKRFGVGIVEKYTPEEWAAQLRNLRKRIGRAGRKSNRGYTADTEDNVVRDGNESVWSQSTATTRPDTIAQLLRESDDEEEDEEEDGRTVVSRRSAKSSVWLKEEGDDDILDLLDTETMTKKISSRDPTLKAKETKQEPNRGFKVAADGRLMIGGEEEEEAGVEQMEDDDDEDFILSGRKRKKNSKQEPEKRTRDGYQAGGSGIHRPLGQDGPDKAKKRKKGDSEKKGGKAVQPYAYFPLEGQALNPRKRAKFQGRFKNLMKGARSGVAKGKKQRSKL